jgi:hypothetical protein
MKVDHYERQPWYTVVADGRLMESNRDLVEATRMYLACIQSRQTTEIELRKDGVTVRKCSK